MASFKLGRACSNPLSMYGAINNPNQITGMDNSIKKQNDEMIELQVDDTERRIIVRALADLRDKQRLAQKNYDFLDSLIVKVCDADSDKSMSLNRGR